ncbi:MAG: hypothetical protein ABMA00_07020 [Gemmatimonas sp.]
MTAPSSPSAPDVPPSPRASSPAAVGAQAPAAGLSAGESLLGSIPAPPPPPPPPPPAASFAIGWILDKGSSAVQYRAVVDVARPEPLPPLTRVPLGSRQGWHLLLMQDSDGTWPAGMLTVPKGLDMVGVGTIPAYRRLIELGWDVESPGMSATKRLLFRLLAEDEDPSLLAELMPAEMDEDLIRRGRLLLREAAAAALAQAGYENDPRLRGAARRLTDRVGNYLKSPLAQKPWMRLGNQHVLPAEVAAPSFHTLLMLAHMPLFRTENHEVMDRLFTYLTQPWPRQLIVQQVGPHLIEQPHLVMGDFLATRNTMDADMPSALAWLEIMARLGFLKKHEGWQRLFDRLLDDRDRKGVWHPPRSVVMPERVPAWSWPVMPLDDHADLAHATSVDVTFRLGLIARLSGRGVELI